MMGKIMCIVGKRLSGVLPVLMSAVCISCGDPVYIDTPYQESWSEQPGTEEEGPGPVDPAVPVKKSLYVTGVEYPRGYNWLPELGAGTVEAKLFLMKDGERILEIKSGSRHQVSADADMHRCIDGHLFTDYSTDAETIVKRDGEELFRYPDREVIYSMLVAGEDVYTLGSPRAGTGFTFRCNGETVIVKGSANILTGLYRDGADIVFAYEDVIKSAKDTRYKYYYVVNGEVKSLAVTDDVLRVNDFRLLNGELHYIAEFSGKSYRVYYAGDSQYELRRTGISGLTGFSFVHDGGSMFVKGKSASGNDTFFWKGAALEAYTAGNMTLAWSADKDNVYHLSGNRTAPYTSLVLKKGGAATPLPSQYELIYSQCMDAYDGQCCVAASNRGNRNSPVIWIDEAVTEYEFNGFFTSVSYQ